MRTNQYRILVTIIVIIAMSIIIVKLQNIEEKTQESMITDNKMVEVIVICPRGIELPEYTILSEMAEQDITNYMLEQELPYKFNFTVEAQMEPALTPTT